MSVPIHTCMVGRACVDEAAYQRLKMAWKINLRHGHFSSIGGVCDHEPRCHVPNAEDIEKLSARLMTDIEADRQAAIAACKEPYPPPEFAINPT